MSIEDREKAFENKFALDQQTFFKMEARASKLLGLWAADLMGLNGPDAMTYAKEVVASNLDEPGFDDVKRKLAGDFSTAKIEISDHMLDSMIEKKMAEARQQIEEEAKASKI
jgi:hypothetical protein